MNYYPLSYQQKKLFNYSQVHKDATEYNVLQGIEMRCDFNKAHFEKVVEKILIEEPILRTKIIERDLEPYQVVSDISEIKIDYRNVDSVDIDDEIEKLSTEPFTLMGGELFQIVVFSCDKGKTIIFLRLHHIICDGWSFQLLIDKFVEYYFGSSVNEESEVRVPQYTYFDYVNEQEKLLKSDKYEKRRLYWEELLTNSVSELNLPWKNSISINVSNSGKRKLFKICEEDSSKLTDFCKNSKISPFTFIASVYGDLISRLSGEKKFNIAVPVANRFTKKNMEICGYFVNTIPLNFNFSEKDTVHNRLRYHHKAFLGMVSKSDTDLNLKCNVMFVFQSRPSSTNKDRDEIEYLRLNNKKSKYDISLSVTFEENCYVFEWEYKKDLLDDSRIDSFNNYLFRLMNGYITNPNDEFTSISLLDDSEIKWQKDYLNNTSEVFEKSSKSIKELFEEAVEQNENEIALIYKDKKITYKEFNRLVNVLCNKLQLQGVKKGQIIPIKFDRGVEMVVAIHALLKLGCAYLPLDVEIPKERLNYILSNSDAKIILSQKKVENICSSNIKVLYLDIDELVGDFENPLTNIKSCDRAYVIYTSGSTGNPKGVINTQSGIVNRLLWMQKEFPIGPNKKVLQKTPYTFDVSVWELVWPLLTGATIVIARPGGHKNPEYISEIIIKENINIVHFVPSMLKQFLTVSSVTKCNSLDYVICSGESLDSPTCRNFYSKLNKPKLVNLYGPTEAAIDVSYFLVEDGLETIPIGRPISNIRLYKLNEQLCFEPSEIPGELYISGVGLAEGYLNDSDKTLESFIPNPWGEEAPYDRLYKTGDIVSIDDKGNFIYHNRKDYQVKIRGQRVELSEIEKVILELDYILNVVVLLKNNSSGQQVLIAFVQSKKQDKIAIRTYLEQHLMDYMIPRSIIFLDEIPTNKSGKVDRRQLLDYPVSIDEDYKEPVNYYEDIVCDVIGQVLGITKVSREANFYDLGGTSLNIYDVKVMVEKRLNQSIPLEIILGFDKVKDISSMIKNYVEKTNSKSNNISLVDELEMYNNIIEEKRESNKKYIDNILITGVTGFVGAYLLKKYLDSFSKCTIHCLVRANNERSGLQRVVDNMKRWKLWKDDYYKHLRIYCADLSKKRLGLSSEEFENLSNIVDLICHNGANVNFSLSYNQLKSENIEGTGYILQLLQQGKKKEFIYISTISVFSKDDYAEGIVYENRLPQNVNQLRLGYSQSKLVAENIINLYKEKGYNIKIFRLGRVTGSSKGGEENEDMFYKILELCKKMKLYPDISINFNGIPVDIVSSLIVYASVSKLDSNTFHIVNPDVNKKIKLSDLFSDCSFERVDWDTWYLECKILSEKGDSLARQVLVSMSEEFDKQKVVIDYSNTMELAHKADVKIPNMEKVIKNIINN